MGARPAFVLPIIFACLGCAGEEGRTTDRAGSHRLAIVSCQGTDRQGGRNLVMITLADDQIQSVSYRRSGDLLVCEVEADRPQLSYPRKRSRWVDDGGQSDVFVQYDDRDVAHMQVIRRGRRIELRMIDYDQEALCGTGREFLPEIAMTMGDTRCQFGR